MPLRVRVWDFLDRHINTIGPEATLGEAMEAMMEAAQTCPSCRSLVVVDEERRPLGVISMRNILEAMKPEFEKWHGLLGQEGWDDALAKGLKECNYRKVKDYMVEVPILHLNDDLLKAYRILTEKKLPVRALPVVEAEKVEGVVRIPELFEALVEAYRKLG